MRDDQAREVASRFQAAVVALERDGEVSAVVELYGPDAYATNNHRLMPQRGRASVRAFWDSYRRTFAAVSSTFGPVMAGDGCAALEWSTTAVLAGNEITYSGVTVLSCADGAALESSVAYFDPAPLRQAFVAPVPGDGAGSRHDTSSAVEDGGVDARPAEEHEGWRTDPEEVG